MKCALLCLFFGCAVWAGPTEVTPLKELALGNRKFTAGVYKELLQEEQGNVIFSPISAETVMALLTVGANGPTKEELIKGLSLPSTIEKTNAAFKELLGNLKSNTENLKLQSANKIYAREDIKLEEAFKKVAVEIYQSDIENIDFSKNVEAVAKINKWVEDHTNNKIKDLLRSSNVDGSTVLVLVNAIYMSAQWQKQFKNYLTKPQKFWKTANDHVEVQTMTQTEYYKYYDNTVLGAKFLEIPYIGEDLSMVIVLPHEKEGLKALEQNPEKLFEPQDMKFERVEVKLPRFTIDTEIGFVDVLSRMGIKKIFHSGQADLSGLAANAKNLVVSDIVQKAFINVTETGTEAAAATAVFVGFTSMGIARPPPPPPVQFYAEHPFSYYIKKGEVILFAGRVNFN